jgi:TrmH family RNA methyltransferase
MQQDLKILTSAQNDTVKQLARLIENARERRRQGVMVLEGIHLVQSALAAGVAFGQVFVNLHAVARPEVAALCAAFGRSVPQYGLDEGLFSRVSALASAPEILAVAARPQPEKPAAGMTRLMLEDIQDPGNMGTILRSAAAAAVTEVFLSAGCVDVFSPKVLRAGMGAHFALSLHEHVDLEAELRAFGGTRLVTSLQGDRSLYAQDLRGAVAFVFGNEGAGVSPVLHDIADARVRIPMPGQAESLNVAMAATLCLFERVRQLDVS